MTESKISSELSSLVQKKSRQGNIPVIITLNEKKHMPELIKKMTDNEVHVDDSYLEPVSMITCSVTANQLKQISEFPEIKKIEYDGQVHAL